MITIEFSGEEIDALDYERFHHPHPKVQKKMEVLYLKAQGVLHQEICRLCNISKGTLVSYLRQYQEGGIERLKHLGYKGQPSELNAHTDSLKAYFKKHPPRSIAEAQDTIEHLTGIKRSPTQVREYLKRIGMRLLKTGFVPGKATSPEKQAEQEAFLEEKLAPRLEEAKAGQRKVYFLDAAHFVFAVFLGFLWCFERVFVPSPSGRRRFNVLGALDAVTHQMITVTNESYINGEGVCRMLDQIAELNKDSTVPISVALDNASYQRCYAVQDHAKLLGIELLFLPSYSPNLNLIERMWKFVKKECLYSKYYKTFEEFRDAIQTCIDDTQTKHKKNLKTLLRLNFQSFKNVKLLAA